MGQAVTSRCESAHWVMKTFIARRESLPKTFLKIEKYLMRQIFKINAKELSDSSKINHKIQNLAIFANICGLVSGFAMEEIFGQYKIYQRSVCKDSRKRTPLRLPCTGEYRITMGLPCCHDIQSIIKDNTDKTIDISKIHRQYLLPRASLTTGSYRQPIYAPLQGKRNDISSIRAAPGKKKRGGRSASRILSHFEQVSTSMFVHI